MHFCLLERNLFSEMMPLTHKRIRIHRVFDRPLKKVGRKPRKKPLNEFTAIEKVELIREFSPTIASRSRLISDQRLHREGIPRGDLIQEIEEQLYEALDYCKKESDQKRYVQRTITNFLIDFLRTHKHHDIHELEGIVESHAKNPVEIAIAKEDRTRLKRVLRQIPADARKMILMHYLEGKTHHEIALELGINKGTATDRIKSAVEKLRQKLIQKN